jgi:predicted aspartyl protease
MFKINIPLKYRSYIIKSLEKKFNSFCNQIYLGNILGVIKLIIISSDICHLKTFNNEAAIKKQILKALILFNLKAYEMKVS